jgi:hypothetical protein
MIASTSSPARVLELEHEIGAKFHRDELIERGLDHGDRGVRGDLEVKEGREEMRHERWFLAKHLDEAVVLQRRHGCTVPEQR